jgi:hypothetical protein
MRNEELENAIAPRALEMTMALAQVGQIGRYCLFDERDKGSSWVPLIRETSLVSEWYSPFYILCVRNGRHEFHYVPSVRLLIDRSLLRPAISHMLRLAKRGYEAPKPSHHE